MEIMTTTAQYTIYDKETQQFKIIEHDQYLEHLEQILDILQPPEPIIDDITI